MRLFDFNNLREDCPNTFNNLREGCPVLLEESYCEEDIIHAFV